MVVYKLLKIVLSHLSAVCPFLILVVHLLHHTDVGGDK